MSKKQERVVILGASNKPERYSYSAFKSLQRHGHKVIPVNPAIDKIEGVPVVESLADISGEIDTVTLYLRPELLEPLVEEIIALKPKRIIANPGAECGVLMSRAYNEGIEYIEACTLVLLSTGQF